MVDDRVERRLLVEDGAGERPQRGAGAGVEGAEQGRVDTASGEESILVMVLVVIDLHKGVWWRRRSKRAREAARRVL